jgi:hypothetical protein
MHHLPFQGGDVDASVFRANTGATAFSGPVDRIINDLAGLGEDATLALDIDLVRFAWKLSRYVVAGWTFTPQGYDVLVRRPNGTELTLCGFPGDDYETTLRAALARLGAP